MIIKFKEFLNESISTNMKQLLQSIDAEQVDLHYTLGIDKDKFINKEIEFIYNDSDFNNQLYSKKLKKSEFVTTKETENFLKRRYELKYFLLIDRDIPKIDNPKYIILQYSNRENKWSDVVMFKVNGNIRNFIEQLTSKTIEILDGEDRYVYQTSNSGNNWVLQNIDDENKTYKETLENDEIKDILSDKNITLNIIE